MFIKRLKIESSTNIIRDIEFKNGLNLILDDTPIDDTKSTGNNVGKTTVLKLIDFCLGANPNIIFTDTENKKDLYTIVKDFLNNEQVVITLTLVESFDNYDEKHIEIQRNFLPGKKAIRKINGKSIAAKDFEDELEKIIIPNKNVEKPTFRQIISHNIRYSDDKINNTLKTLNTFTTGVEYETLYLYLLGCSFNEGAKKQALTAQIKQENIFKERLEKKQGKTTYEIALALLEDDIVALNEKKSSFNLNETLEKDLEQLNLIKYNINKVSSLISKFELRKELIEQSKQELENSISHIDLQQLRVLYNEVKLNISGVQKTFEDLVVYHNNMVVEKVKYISQDLPQIIEKLKGYHNELSALIAQERKLTERVSKGDSFKELEIIIAELNEKYRKKGEYESIIGQLDEVEDNINHLNRQIEVIDQYLFSGDFEGILKEQIKKFNKFFSTTSQELYGEKYALTYKKELNKKGQQFYTFNAFNANMSPGKKQGEILCFDLAYLLFAEEEHILHLHFLLNDKKELMHDNQLVNVAEFVQHKNIQLVISILKDKLPTAVLDKAHIVVELSQKEKLFKIENLI